MCSVLTTGSSFLDTFDDGGGGDNGFGAHKQIRIENSSTFCLVCVLSASRLDNDNVPMDTKQRQLNNNKRVRSRTRTGTGTGTHINSQWEIWAQRVKWSKIIFIIIAAHILPVVDVTQFNTSKRTCNVYYSLLFRVFYHLKMIHVCCLFSDICNVQMTNVQWMYV